MGYVMFFKSFKRSKPKNTVVVETTQSDRRKNPDRRSFGPPAHFPLVDCNGKMVSNDRRTIPDRRISSIQVSEHHLHFSNQIFSK